MKGEVVKGGERRACGNLDLSGKGIVRSPEDCSTAGTNLVTHVLGIQEMHGRMQETLAAEFQRLWDLDSIGIRERERECA